VPGAANPGKAGFAEAIDRVHPGVLARLRGLLTSKGCGQSVNLMLGDFERETGIHGIRLAPPIARDTGQRRDRRQPETLPLLFPAMDVEDRRPAVAEEMRSNFG
jgi:hypothetical protein